MFLEAFKPLDAVPRRPDYHSKLNDRQKEDHQHQNYFSRGEQKALAPKMGSRSPKTNGACEILKSVDHGRWPPI
jgi:hypothetical protein